MNESDLTAYATSRSVSSRSMVAEGQLNHCECGELSRRVGLIGPDDDYGVCLDNGHVVLWLTGVRPRRAAVHVAAQMGI
jgi:hypothetical protein